MSFQNRFKQALAAGRPQYGLVSGLHEPYGAQLLAGAGFDWLLLDGEHSPLHAPGLAQLLALYEAAGASEVALRPGRADASSIGLALDLGVRTLVVPMVESAAQAARFVAMMRFPPDGTRGVGTALTRAARWGRERHYLRDAADALCLVAQIESLAGVQAAADIARVEGVDALLIGPSDLAASLGHLGDPEHPDVRRSIEQVVHCARDAGKAVGLFVRNPQAAAHWREQGCGFFIVGVDTAIIVQAFDRVRADYPRPSEPLA